MADDRYFTIDDVDTGVDAEELGKLPMEKQVEYMAAWFNRYYEDPAQETPYQSAEGGYIYIHGGPYDAEEELRYEFEGVVSEEAIKEAVEEVQSDNGVIEWAPTSLHPAREDEGQEQDQPPTAEEILDQITFGSVQPKFGSEAENNQRSVVLERLDAIEQLLNDLIPKPGEIGHNGPPGSITGEQVADITQAIGEIRSQMAEPAPDVERVAQAATILERLGRWLWEKFDKGVDAATKAVGTAVGTAAVAGTVAFGVGHGEALLDAVELATSSVVYWLTLVI